MENKFTDNEIINCLNDTEGKEDIGIYCTDKNGNFTTVVKLTDLVDLLNRQKADIERLIGDVTAYKVRRAKAEASKETAKSEARKEFAERLKNATLPVTLGGKYKYDVITKEGIDNLLKEMEGADK